MLRTLNDILKTHKHICWYPSANADFRGLLYLSNRYFEWKKIPREAGQELPDLFIMTDIYPHEIINYAGSYEWKRKQEEGYSDIYLFREGRWRKIRNLYRGYRYRSYCVKDDKHKTVRYKEYRQKVTEINVTHIERLCDIKLDFRPEFFIGGVLEHKPPYYGNAFYIQAHVESIQRESSPEPRRCEYDSDIVYILTDNTSFARDYLLKNKISTEYVMQIRYGDNMGRSAVSGRWLGMMLDSLNCKYFMANPRYAEDVDVTAMPTVVKEFFDGYQVKPVSFNMIAPLRNHKFCLYDRENEFDDINLYRVIKHSL